jgi:hypothetical protein
LKNETCVINVMIAPGGRKKLVSCVWGEWINELTGIFL